MPIDVLTCIMLLYVTARPLWTRQTRGASVQIAKTPGANATPSISTKEGITVEFNPPEIESATFSVVLPNVLMANANQKAAVVYVTEILKNWLDSAHDAYRQAYHDAARAVQDAIAEEQKQAALARAAQEQAEYDAKMEQQRQERLADSAESLDLPF